MISEPNKAINLFRNSMSVMKPRKEAQWIKTFPSVPQQDVRPSIIFYRLFFSSLLGKLFKGVGSKEAEGTTRVHREKEDTRVITPRYMGFLPVASLPFSIVKLRYTCVMRILLWPIWWKRILKSGFIRLLFLWRKKTITNDTLLVSEKSEIISLGLMCLHNANLLQLYNK